MDGPYRESKPTPPPSFVARIRASMRLNPAGWTALAAACVGIVGLQVMLGWGIAWGHGPRYVFAIVGLAIECIAGTLVGFFYLVDNGAPWK